MKNILFLFVFACFSLFFAERSDAQCYVRLEDASGFNTDAYQDTLQAAAAKLCAIFDSTGFAGQFKVYDFGFYLHQENTTGGYPEPFAQKMAEVQDSSPYYLLFGKQTDQSGVYTRFWVDLVLPSDSFFSCMTDLERSTFEYRIRNRANDNLSNNPSLFYTREIEAMSQLMSILFEIKDCCYVGQRMMGCSGCTDELAQEYFESNHFFEIPLQSIQSILVNIESESIVDYSDVVFFDNNQNQYLGNFLTELSDDYNEFYDLKFLITSNASLCAKDLDDLESYHQTGEFNCWINLMPNSSSIYIKIVWNSIHQKNASNQLQADNIASNLYCNILSYLGVAGNNCGANNPPPPQPQYNLYQYPNQGQK